MKRTEALLIRLLLLAAGLVGGARAQTDSTLPAQAFHERTAAEQKQYDAAAKRAGAVLEKVKATGTGPEWRGAQLQAEIGVCAVDGDHYRREAELYAWAAASCEKIADEIEQKGRARSDASVDTAITGFKQRLAAIEVEIQRQVGKTGQDADDRQGLEQLQRSANEARANIGFFEGLKAGAAADSHTAADAEAMRRKADYFRVKKQNASAHELHADTTCTRALFELGGLVEQNAKDAQMRGWGVEPPASPGGVRRAEHEKSVATALAPELTALRNYLHAIAEQVASIPAVGTGSADLRADLGKLRTSVAQPPPSPAGVTGGAGDTVQEAEVAKLRQLIVDINGLVGLIDAAWADPTALQTRIDQLRKLINGL